MIALPTAAVCGAATPSLMGAGRAMVLPQPPAVVLTARAHRVTEYCPLPVTVMMGGVENYATSARPANAIWKRMALLR